jgi:hypothetical protein
MAAENKSPESTKDAPRRSMERLVRRFGAVWVASQDGMAAIGATRKDALAGLADCIKCKTMPNNNDTKIGRGWAANDALFGWLPISTAPKDGTLIDLCCESVEGVETYQIRLTDVAWHEADHILPHTGWARITDDAEMDLVDSPPTCPLGLPRWKPKYWRPLPSLPNDKSDSR